MFALRQKIKDEGNDLSQEFVNINMNSLYGVEIRKGVNQFYKCKSENWMRKEYDDNVLEITQWKIYSEIKKNDGCGW